MAAANEPSTIEHVADLLGEIPVESGGDRRWDGSDRLLLETFVNRNALGTENLGVDGDALLFMKDVLLMNDQHGALLHVLIKRSKAEITPWKLRQLESFSDDVRSARVCASLSEQHPWVSFVPSTDLPQNPTLVILRVSPVEAILRAQIILLLAMQARGARFSVIAAGLDRLLPSKTKTLLSLLGPTDTLPGAHKSHAFLSQVGEPLLIGSDHCLADDETRTGVDPENSGGEHDTGLSLAGNQIVFAGEMPVDMGGKILSFATGPYAFSAGRLDLGSRLLIEAITAATSFGRNTEGQPGRVADLACGNGVVGVMAHLAHKPRSLYFSDVSFSAVALAERNAVRHSLKHAEFAADTGFDHYAGPRFDAVLLNPPFHHHGGVDEELGAQLFASAHGHLRVGGELWVVGNRHLGYQKTLQSMFGHCRLVRAHPKFVVLVAQRGATRIRAAKAIQRTVGRTLSQRTEQNRYADPTPIAATK